ncbi:NifB/NifX family molybdenum-iron cluster-binding protein [Fusobacterium ulcerans]|uniref:NifB/NifX family molybdenum-iron cluster-binding protein n=1 Tax=Fusobacterium ulcerans TaxID=861 RepID=UPI001032EB38|nr:NifB/NifX family molybdenum-iron cluster-binding protein [Fusobacterium ulcerans]
MSNEILRVGFSTNDEVMLEGHFGHCEKFVIYTIENGKAVKKEIVATPEHAPGVFPKFIAEQKVNVVITGGMGQKAIDMLKANGTEVILGASGKIEDILKTYLEGTLVSNGVACAHHHHDHHEEHNCKH